MKNGIKLLFISGLAFLSAACSFFSSVEESINGKSYDADVTNVSFSVSTMNVNENESEYLQLSLSPKSNQGKCSVSWEYDSEHISAKTDNFGAIITGVKAGPAYIKASCNGIVATCLVSVVSAGDDTGGNPYIYSNYSVVQMRPGDSTTVTASLYGGSISDMENFQWEIKDASVAEIDYARNSCVISAKKTGSTQIEAKHPDAEYPYTFVVYVYTDKMAEPYITTSSNIITINKNTESSRTVSVDLVNPVSALYADGFSWSYADEESREIIQLNANRTTAEIVPKSNGIAKIVVRHENAEYPLEIIVRVNTIVQNTYIEVSPPTVVITGSSSAYTVRADVKNYDGYVDPDAFKWDVPEEAGELAECDISGNTVRILGKKNGTFKIKVSHGLSEYSRNVLVVLQEQIGSAVDSSMYITTDQNYVQTRAGDDVTTVNIRLVGGDEGDQKDFVWLMDKGKNNDIAEIEYVDGDVQEARNAASSGKSVSGKLVIRPLSAGILKITASHPRCLYDCEITVRVYSKYALLEEPVQITTADSLVRLLNGKTADIKAELTNAAAGEENNIGWSSSDTSSVSLAPETGAQTVINACGSGSRQTYVTAHLDKAIADRKILVLTADTAEALDAMKGIYSDVSYVRLTAGTEKEVCVNAFGLSSSDRISWKTSDSSVCAVNASASSENGRSAVITGFREGEAEVSASVDGAEPVVFSVTVLPEGESPDVIEAPKYLTTNMNAVVLEKIGDSQNLSVTGVNIDASDMSLRTKWTMEDKTEVECGGSVFTLSASGPDATLTAESKGKSVITVSNEKAGNSLRINAKCGELYEWTDGYAVYITSDSDVVNIMKGSSAVIGCSLVNTTDRGKFFWNVASGGGNIEIVGTADGVCTVNGVQAGQAVISVTNELSGEISKEILVNVANSEEELKGFRYLTTEQNVVTVGEGSSVSVAVSVRNSDRDIINGYSWRSTVDSVAAVTGSGSIAVIHGKSCGTAKIIVENTECEYPLEIIVNTVDPLAAAEDPYILCNNIVTCTVGGENAVLSAELVGGSGADVNAFSWDIADPSVARLYASNDTAEIKALKEGMTQVIVRHPKASVDRSVLVICEPKAAANCSISVAESIIKMSPTDEARTITATLVNGVESDVYDFKWWADSYDRINMNYTGNSCIVEPIGTGVVNIHVSHPKAAAQRDIVLYISSYSDFAFETPSVTLSSGTDTFLNMEVPATGIDCIVSYSSDDESVCAVSGNTSVCILHPTYSGDAEAKTCRVKAVLQTKGGAKQAEAELLVVVQKKDGARPFIELSGGTPSVITMNKGEQRSLSAAVSRGTDDGSGLNWSVSEANGKVVEFLAGQTMGKEVTIKALNSGKTTIKIEHSEAAPRTLYVIVAGASEPSVTLNYSSLPLYVGEDTKTLAATIVNDNNYTLSWSVSPENQDFFTFTSSGNRASVYAKKPGKASVSCTINETGSFASCDVEIKEAEKLNFFMYADEKTGADRQYISDLQLYPGESKALHYEAVPANDAVKNWHVSDTAYFLYEDKGYGASWAYRGNSYSYAPDVGTVIITGKTRQGTASLSATSASGKNAAVSINNSYNYRFQTSRSMVSATPYEVHNEPELLYVDYEIRPACSKIYVDILGSGGEHLALSGAEKTSSGWVVSAHEAGEDTSATGLAKGKLKFSVNGECNCRVQLKAVNENVVTSGTSTVPSETVGVAMLDIKVYYESHTFTPGIVLRAPSLNYTRFSGVTPGMVSRFDSATNTFFIGDGERLSGNMAVNEPYSNVQIKEIKFVKSDTSIRDEISKNPDDGKVQSELVKCESSAPRTNSAPYSLYHDKDYGCFEYVLSNGFRYRKKQFYRLGTAGDESTENKNSTVKEKPYVGYLSVKYYSFASNKDDVFTIPVYVEVRNSPCLAGSPYYKELDPAEYGE